MRITLHPGAAKHACLMGPEVLVGRGVCRVSSPLSGGAQGSVTAQMGRPGLDLVCVWGGGREEGSRWAMTATQSEVHDRATHGCCHVFVHVRCDVS